MGVYLVIVSAGWSREAFAGCHRQVTDDKQRTSHMEVGEHKQTKTHTHTKRNRYSDKRKPTCLQTKDLVEGLAYKCLQTQSPLQLSPWICLYRKRFSFLKVFQEKARFRCCPLPLLCGKAILRWHALILLLSCPAWALWSWQNIIPDLCRHPQPPVSINSKVLLGLKQASLLLKLEVRGYKMFSHLVDIKKVKIFFWNNPIELHWRWDATLTSDQNI